jgi:hypothetical protein
MDMLVLLLMLQFIKQVIKHIKLMNIELVIKQLKQVIKQKLIIKLLKLVVKQLVIEPQVTELIK